MPRQDESTNHDPVLQLIQRASELRKIGYDAIVKCDERNKCAIEVIPELPGEKKTSQEERARLASITFVLYILTFSCASIASILLVTTFNVLLGHAPGVYNPLILIPILAFFAITVLLAFIIVRSPRLRSNGIAKSIA